MSLEQKLPLIIGALLLLVIVTLSVAAYREVRGSAIRVASDRLSSVTLQFRDLFQQSAAQIRAQAATVASRQELAAFARDRRGPSRSAALAALQYRGPQPEAVVGAELRGSTGRVILSTVPSSVGLDTMAVNDALPRTEPGDSATIGTYRRLRDTIVYPVAAPVIGAPDAYVVHWRRVAASRRGREQLTQLIGSNASLVIGSPASNLWTDLERPVRAPQVVASVSPTIQEYARADGSRRLAAAALVPGTPWTVMVDFPKSDVMAPVQAFLRRMAWITGIVLIVGLAVAWTVSRRITDPLRQLTHAADAITAGDYSQRVSIERSDELGRLGQAFSTMAAEVQQSREHLERKVAERTRDLNATLEQLHDAQEVLVRKERLAILGQLSSGVGHELRNPLGVMTNAVYYLKTVLSSAPANIHEYLEILQQQITLSEKIVSDLLDFARQKPPQRRPTSLAEVTQMQVSRLSANGVRFETNLPNDLPLVLADHTQIGQIVLNLLTNAVQAVGGKEGGTIRIRAGSENNRVRYEVEDNGPGIAPENLDKIFEPLFTTKARGIGLGLAVSRTLARANDGDLTVTSSLGQGAKFQLWLETPRATAVTPSVAGAGGGASA